MRNCLQLILRTRDGRFVWGKCVGLDARVWSAALVVDGVAHPHAVLLHCGDVAVLVVGDGLVLKGGQWTTAVAVDGVRAEQVLDVPRIECEGGHDETPVQRDTIAFIPHRAQVPRKTALSNLYYIEK